MQLELAQLKDIKATIMWLLENGEFTDLETSYNIAMNAASTLDAAMANAGSVRFLAINWYDGKPAIDGCKSFLTEKEAADYLLSLPKVEGVTATICKTTN